MLDENWHAMKSLHIQLAILKKVLNFPGLMNFNAYAHPDRMIDVLRSLNLLFFTNSGTIQLQRARNK